MAKIKLSESNFKMINEGYHIFKIMEVNDSKYEDFGKLEVKMQNAKGETHIERFSLLNTKGDLNEGALKAWSYFARNCLGDFKADEIDTQDIIGCFVGATVKHEEYDKKDGGKGKSARLSDYNPEKGFSNSDDADDLDLDDELGDLD